MAERARIGDELARIERLLLLKGLPAGPKPIPIPIRGASVHGRWDGIVGHPVDVVIKILV